MNCVKCGVEIMSDVHFCPKCGTAVKANSEITVNYSEKRIRHDFTTIWLILGIVSFSISGLLQLIPSKETYYFEIYSLSFSMENLHGCN